MFQNSTSDHLNEFKHKVEDFNVLQLSIVAFLMDLVSKTSAGSDTNSHFRDILHLFSSPTHLMKDIVQLLQTPIEENRLAERIDAPNLSFPNFYKLFNDHKNDKTSNLDKNSEAMKSSESFISPFEVLLNNIKLSEVQKIKDFVDKTVADSSNITILTDTIDKLKSVKGEDILGELLQSKKIPFLHETINSTQHLIKVTFL